MVYNIMDLLGDIGGILEALTIFIGVFIFPISEFGFVLKAANFNYYTRKPHKQIFLTEKLLF